MKVKPAFGGRGGFLHVATVLFFGALISPPPPVARCADRAFPTDPDKAKFVTSDIGRFWSILDTATPANRAKLLQEEYINNGSAGVKDFVQARIISGERFAQTIQEHPEWYSETVRQNTMKVLTIEKKIRAGFYSLKYLYPEGVFPDVYFVVGRHNSGGTASSNGLLIGAEMNATSTDQLENLPALVAHEWVHFQQKQGGSRSLLLKALGEGSADFIAELGVGEHNNKNVHNYAEPREREVWERFRAVMDQPFPNDNTKGWAYGGKVFEDGPNDLAYYVGYKISAAYYKKATDKRQAVKDILTLQDPVEFLKASGYADKFK